MRPELDLQEGDEFDMKIEQLIETWGFDEDVAAEVVAMGNETELSPTMFISADGMVYSSQDAESMKKDLLDYCVNEGPLEDIKYLTIDGVEQDVMLSFSFKPKDIATNFDPATLETVPTPEAGWGAGAGDIY